MNLFLFLVIEPDNIEDQILRGWFLRPARPMGLLRGRSWTLEPEEDRDNEKDNDYEDKIDDNDDDEEEDRL